MLTNHPFQGSMTSIGCNLCGRGRGDAIHKTGFDRVSREVHSRLPAGAQDAVKLAVSIAEIIREAGEIPNGHLYAALMDRMSLSTYQGIIAVLKQAGVIAEQFHMLRYTGPTEVQP